MWKSFTEAPRDGTHILIRFANGNMRPAMWIKPHLYSRGCWKALDGWPWPSEVMDEMKTFTLITTV